MGQAIATMAGGCFSDYVVLPLKMVMPVATMQKEIVALLTSGLTASIGQHHSSLVPCPSVHVHCHMALYARCSTFLAWSCTALIFRSLIAGQLCLLLWFCPTWRYVCKLGPLIHEPNMQCMLMSCEATQVLLQHHAHHASTVLATALQFCLRVIS